MSADSPYVSATQTAALSSAQACGSATARMKAADMITTLDAAELAGTSRMTISAWINGGRCIGVSNVRRSFKLLGRKFW